MTDDELKKIMRRSWETACQDKPSRPSCIVQDGHFVFTVTGNNEKWQELCKAAGVPSHATQTIESNKLTCKWLSHADAIFGYGGLMSQHLPNYEPRIPQLQMARMVQRTIEMDDTSVIEAGTGVGKGFAYAAIAMAMGRRMVISTSNKALQMQLYQKDIPFLSKLFPGKTVAMVQGKQNYLCKARIEDGFTGATTITGDLQKWYLETETGNTEELPFSVEWQELSKITVDEYCTGKHCAFYNECFYYKAKRKRAEADVLICNHMLLAMHYLYPTSDVLPGVLKLIVVDEAHKFADYVRNALGEDISFSRLAKQIDIAQKHHVTSNLDNAVINFQTEIMRLVNGNMEPQIGITEERLFTTGMKLSNTLRDAADEIFPEDETPSREQKHLQVDANRLRNTATALDLMSGHTPEGNVRWFDTKEQKLCLAPYDVSSFIGEIVERKEETVVIDSTHCARCNRELTAKTVHVLAGVPYGSECIKHVDPLGDAEVVNREEWFGEPRTAVEVTRIAPPVVFCSATLATPDMATFMRDCGIADAMTMIAASPFDYENNAMLYIPAGASPSPDQPEFTQWMITEIKTLVNYARGGAFLLFTSYKNMQAATQSLRHDFERMGLLCLVQGEMPKLEIAKRFKDNGNAVLFATKSFWEGVSVEDDALRLVIIDKMPFASPSPLFDAQKRHLSRYAAERGIKGRDLEWYPFNNLDVPVMTLDLKQGAGRLIRTQRDKGVIAILDSRLRSKQYARQRVLPSLPPAYMVSEKYMVADFFERMRQDKAQNNRLIADLEPIQHFGIQAGHEIEPMFA